MLENPKSEDGELDLRELLAAIWSHKILIALLTSLSIFFFGYIALTADKEYTAFAIFEVSETNANSGFSLPSELGALASLAGLSAGKLSSGTDVLLERATGREFILDMKEKFSLDFDPFFNFYDPDYKDPLWKATIKQIIGWKKTELERKAIIEHNVTDSYREYVVYDTTDGGAISITVTHADAKKAADYANGFMEELRFLVENESNEAQDLRLNYLSETLADALQEMERAQENLKNYALKNSALAQENFISDSLKLDKIRMEKRKVEEIFDLLSIIEDTLKNENIDDNSYEALRLSHPLVDDIDFRRILGMSESISAWTWPELETIEAVSATLRDRIKRLHVNIKNIEENAKIYATSAEDLAKFTRDAKIAEATYTVLIEQVKSQSLAAGFQPETFKVFEYATPPLGPSSPNRKLLLAAGAVLGVIVGSFLAVMNSARRGVYYSRNILMSDTRASVALKSKLIKRLSRKSIPEIISFFSNRRMVEIDEAALMLANKEIIYVLNSGGRPSASDAARLLAARSSLSGRNIVLCDNTGQSEREVKSKSRTDSSDLPFVNIGNNINVMTGVDDSSFFTSTNFKPKIKDLINHYDQVFICASKRDAQLGLMALLEFSPGLVVISSLRKTKKIDIENITKMHTIDLLLYD